MSKMLDAITPEVYERFKSAVEIKKWPDGTQMSPEQLAICMEAIITYEAAHLAPEDRTGYVPPKSSACEPEPVAENTDTPIRWQ